MNKNKMKVYDRLNATIRDMHHNASLNFPYDLIDAVTAVQESDGYDLVYAWASFEIDYMNDGLAYSTSELYPTNKELGKKRFKPSDSLLVARLVNEYGRLYQWGRSGATLAPERLIRGRGGSSYSFISFETDEITYAEAVELIQMIEAFNRYVSAWCSEENLSYMLREALDTNAQDLESDAKETREFIRFLIKDIRALDLSDKFGARQVLRERVKKEIAELKDYQTKALIARKAISC